MWEYVRTLLGEVTMDEVALAAVLVVCVLGFSWAPRIGEALGGLFEQDRDEG